MEIKRQTQHTDAVAMSSYYKNFQMSLSISILTMQKVTSILCSNTWSQVLSGTRAIPLREQTSL